MFVCLFVLYVYLLVFWVVGFFSTSSYVCESKRKPREFMSFHFSAPEALVDLPPSVFQCVLCLS